jgi:GT2 family glycosyltransferase
MRLASVIIPVWNGIADLPACLNALQAQGYAPVEIIAVDNHSTDGSADWIAAHHPSVRLIHNAENLGFGGACNVGLAQAKGDVLIFLNQDTIVQPHWLSALVTTLAEQTDVGIVGSKALYADGTLQHAGGTVDAQGGGSHLGYRQVDQGQFDRLMDVDYVTGASLALRRKTYEEIGGFDPGFHPAYLEDVDLCWRTRAAGWRVVYVPQSVLIHNERSMAAVSTYEGMLIYQRHRLRFVCKHWSAEQLRNEFLPVERAWLNSFGLGGERLLAVAHHAYLHQLLNLGELATWRQRLLGEAPEAIMTVAQTLLTLRTVYPQTLTSVKEREEIMPLIPLDKARPLAEIREQPFRSDTPLVGSWIAAFRRQWNRVSTEWYVKPMIRQQSHFNTLLLDALQQSHHQQHKAEDRTAALAAVTNVLAEYLAGQEREISTLSQELAAIKRQLAERKSGHEAERDPGEA